MPIRDLMLFKLITREFVLFLAFSLRCFNQDLQNKT